MGGRGTTGSRGASLGKTTFYEGVSSNVIRATNASKQWLHDEFEGLADKYFPVSLELRDRRSSEIAQAYSNMKKIILYRPEDYDIPTAIHETTHIITNNLFNPEKKTWSNGQKQLFDSARREVYKMAGLKPNKTMDIKYLNRYASTDSSEFFQLWWNRLQQERQMC